MIKDIKYSNDKSSIQILPKNYGCWFGKEEFRKYLGKLSFKEFQDNEFPFRTIMYMFADYLKSNGGADKVLKMTHKYKIEIYNKFYMISHSLRRPFGFYVNFNYIEYKNNSGFNYIIHCSEYDDLKPFVKDIILDYMDKLDQFLTLLKEEWSVIKDKKDLKYDIMVIKCIEKFLIKHYKINPLIALVSLSVTCDIHFKDHISKNVFFNNLKKIQQEKYKIMIIDNETVFLYPYNRNLQSYNKYIPKIRFYDKQKDTMFRYYLHKKKEGLSLMIKDYEDFSVMERFSAIDIVSQEKLTLDKDYIKAMKDLENTIRFEVDFPKHSIKKALGSNLFFDLNINNRKLLLDYLNNTLDFESTAFNVTVFHDLVTNEKEVVKYKNIKVSPLGCSGDLSSKYNFILKNYDFLNKILSNIYVSEKKVIKTGEFIKGSNDQITKEITIKNNLSCDMTSNAVSSKLKRFRHRGVVRGNGRSVIILEPYRTLLDLHNYYFINEHMSKCVTSETRHAVPVELV